MENLTICGGNRPMVPPATQQNMQYLDSQFQNRIISRNSINGIDWPARSPDLNPCDFFPWGYMKELVYKPLPTSLHQLKEKVTLTFRNIPEPMVQKAVYGMKKRAKKTC